MVSDVFASLDGRVLLRNSSDLRKIVLKKDSAFLQFLLGLLENWYKFWMLSYSLIKGIN